LASEPAQELDPVMQQPEPIVLVSSKEGMSRAGRGGSGIAHPGEQFGDYRSVASE
jgi:hypothetical protein